MASRKPSQSNMFPSGDDLPLFSGTAMSVRVRTFSHAPQPRQSSFATCPVCRDTGVVFTRHLVYCSCEIGRDVAAANHKKSGDEPQMTL
jgi:hypothetical protein